MKNLVPTLAIIALFTTLSACSALIGEEIARLPINEISTSDDNLIIKETSVDLKKGDQISIWSEMDMAYEGNAPLLFKIELLKNGESLGVMEIDPTDKNITIGEVQASLMGKTNWKFSGKNTQVEIEEDGHYTFKGILVAAENPTLVINKAEIVLKK